MLEYVTILSCEITIEQIATSPNMPKKDAQLLFTMEFASCSCPQVRCYAIINSGQEHDFFGRHVICHLRKETR
jgi:hypothetical protein